MNSEINNEEGLDLVTSLKGIVERILKLDIKDEDEDLQYCFKVLIFDDYVFEIISPLLKVYHNKLDLHLERVQHYSSHEHKGSETKNFRCHGYLYSETNRGEF
jgi:hypothetical protein